MHVLYNLFFVFILLQIYVYGIHLYPYYLAYKDNISDKKMLSFKIELRMDLISTLLWMMIIPTFILSFVFLLMYAKETNKKKEVPLLVRVITYAYAFISLYFYIIRNDKRYNMFVINY